ncbi:MAG: hypothetical protein JOZ15_07655, partial [Acidobacteria bacterium]|nr:hypothetical protein [Acidobacteriota bacterium]
MHRKHLETSRTRSSKRIPWRGVVLGLSAVVASGGLVGSAGAAPGDQPPVTLPGQASSIVQDPGTAGQGTPAGSATATKYTPVPESVQQSAAIGWQQVGGAVFPGVQSPSYTDTHAFAAPDLGSGATVPDYTVDFYSVSFVQNNPNQGFAAGAACKDLATQNNDTALTACQRVPVIYQYSHWPTALDPLVWREVYRGAGSTGDGRGFVGAVAWIPKENKAVAVGGDGCYPSREISCADAGDPANAPDQTDADPIAGNALAWVY